MALEDEVATLRAALAEVHEVIEQLQNRLTKLEKQLSSPPPQPAPPATHSKNPWRPKRVAPLPFVIMTLLVLLGAGVGGFFLLHSTVMRTASHHVTKPRGKPTVKIRGRPATVAGGVKGMNANPAYQWWVNPTGLQPDSWWGSAQTTTTLNKQISLLLQLGVTSYRFEVPWPFVEPSKPGGRTYNSTTAQDPAWTGYNWTRLDLITHLLTQAGIEPVPIIVYSPSWASGVATTTGSGPNIAPTDSRYYTDFLTALVKRYRDRVHIWELWNEPDAGHTWSGTLAHYVSAILQPGYRAIKVIDPTATVLLGGLVSASDLQQVYAAGGKGYFDVATIHVYPSMPNYLTVQYAVNTALGTMQQNQDMRPLWVTEVGIMTQPASDGTGTYTTTQGQEQLIANVYAHVKVPRIYWYELADTDVYRTGNVLLKHVFWGIVTHDLTVHKPGFAAYQAARRP